jgi:hypothetical protein
MCGYSRLFVLAFAASVAGLAPAAAAEMPTDAQKKAIQTHCRSDFIKHCSGVTPGGLPALECENGGAKLGHGSGGIVLLRAE